MLNNYYNLFEYTHYFDIVFKAKLRLINNTFLSIYIFNVFDIFVFFIDKKVSGKSKDEQMAEKKQELEKRLQDVTGQLGNVKKTAKKGWYFDYNISLYFYFL